MLAKCCSQHTSGAGVSGLADDPLNEDQLGSERVFDGTLLKVWRDRVRLPDGGESVREFVRHPGAVVVVAQLPDGLVLFERQFRYPLRRAFLELPAGKIDAGEDIFVCAQRELREETGYAAAEWQHVGVMHPCIGYSDERIEIFFATELTYVGHARDEGEFLEILQMDVDAAEAAIHAGEITDAKTITALYRTLPLIRRQSVA